jgi:hypothetical protein
MGRRDRTTVEFQTLALRGSPVKASATTAPARGAESVAGVIGGTGSSAAQ